ncbi:MAG: tetratricopeptide repeat protein [Thermoanaerobaculia bacterium]|nr:tetratricopeptide repeat protein [Thermoanaerobaculia bacterium]
MSNRNVFVVVAFWILATLSAAQTIEQAEELSAEQKYEEAVRAYRAVVAEEPNLGRAWYGMGRALQSLERYGAALEAFEKAGELGFQPGGVFFRKGTLHLEMGRLEEAKKWLSKAAENGVPVYRLAESFPSFEKVKDDEDFQRYLDSLAPCASREYHQFDFWAGDWDVYDPSGQKVGENTIERILNGCVVYESWAGVGGSEGRSFNRWDPDSETWNQHWVSNNGNEIVMRGTFEEGRMVLETLEGATPWQRWTWYEVAPRKVRQMAEQTTDGETWSVVWDSVYIPKGSEWEPVDLD